MPKKKWSAKSREELQENKLRQVVRQMILQEGMKTIEESAIEENDDIPSKAKTQLEKAINKCNLVIDEAF